MSTFLLRGRFPVRGGITHDGAVELSWGMWMPHEADNDADGDDAANKEEWRDDEAT